MAENTTLRLYDAAKRLRTVYPSAVERFGFGDDSFDFPLGFANIVIVPSHRYGYTIAIERWQSVGFGIGQWHSMEIEGVDVASTVETLVSFDSWTGIVSAFLEMYGNRATRGLEGFDVFADEVVAEIRAEEFEHGFTVRSWDDLHTVCDPNAYLLAVAERYDLAEANFDHDDDPIATLFRYAINYVDAALRGDVVAVGSLTVVKADEIRVGMVMRMRDGNRYRVNWIGTTSAGAKSLTAMNEETGLEDWWIFNRDQRVTVEAQVQS